MARMAAYQVEKTKRPVKITRRVYDKETKKFSDEDIEIVDGFMVYFPQGHSTFFASVEALRAAGLTEKPRTVDMEGDGEDVVDENVHVLTPKDMVKRAATRRSAIGE